MGLEWVQSECRVGAERVQSGCRVGDTLLLQCGGIHGHYVPLVLDYIIYVTNVDACTMFSVIRMLLLAASGIPAGFRLQAMQGFVEELVVNDDPEYQWIDKIRSMRASNEARQLAFSRLTGEQP